MAVDVKIDLYVNGTVDSNPLRMSVLGVVNGGYGDKM